ncbi:hypothetical protein ACQPW1_38390 [Nocardia sp. CA-128927]|uniref:non-homologous end-joining DNA ligase LigD n=1 Tax=Nocardia sp. CA-128927 TaxID=3239975 RepID=UPI003D95E33B
MGSEEVRAGVTLTNLDKPLFDGAEATKRDLVDYLEAVGERLVRQLRDRPLSVLRVRPGQQPFMQKGTGSARTASSEHCSCTRFARNPVKFP